VQWNLVSLCIHLLQRLDVDDDDEDEEEEEEDEDEDYVTFSSSKPVTG
jgi:hypothetical protein